MIRELLIVKIKIEQFQINTHLKCVYLLNSTFEKY